MEEGEKSESEGEIPDDTDVPVEVVERRHSVFEKRANHAWKELTFNFAFLAVATSIFVVADDKGMIPVNPLSNPGAVLSFFVWILVIAGCFFRNRLIIKKGRKNTVYTRHTR